MVADLDFAGGSGLVFFPSNKGWRGPLSLLEITDKRKGIAYSPTVNFLPFTFLQQKNYITKNKIMLIFKHREPFGHQERETIEEKIGSGQVTMNF